MMHQKLLGFGLILMVLACSNGEEATQEPPQEENIERNPDAGEGAKAKKGEGMSVQLSQSAGVQRGTESVFESGTFKAESPEEGISVDDFNGKIKSAN